MKLLCSLLLASSLTIQANQNTINTIEQASMELNTSKLAVLTEKTSDYAQALAYYRLAIAQNLQAQNVQANHSIDLAIQNLETITQQQNSHDEAWTLLAQVYGLKIAYQPMKAAFYGPKASQALAKALTLNETNPRAFLVKGISAYHTPEMFGGSKEQALTAFNTAISLFEQDASNESWGQAEAHIWRGLTKLSINKKTQAIADWQTALTIEPNYGWAKMLIQSNQ